MTKKDWAHTFFDVARVMSERSDDPHTKCGCVLANKTNEIIATGYNGSIRGSQHGQIPLTRPEKYDYMVHSEHNAVLNCARQGRSTIDAVAYITGAPCNWCIQYMWQAGIKEMYYTDFNKPKMMDNDEHRKVRAHLLDILGPLGLKMSFIKEK